MKKMEQHEFVSVSGGATNNGSPALIGIGLPVDFLPMPIDPVYMPELS